MLQFTDKPAKLKFGSVIPYHIFGKLLELTVFTFPM